MAAAWPRLLAVTHAARAAQSPSPPALLLLSHNPLFCLSANTLSNTTGAQSGSGLQTRGTWPCPASTYRFVRFRQPAATCHTCHTCNVAQFVAFQTVKQEHRKSFLPCRHLAAPSYIINNTSSSIYHINDQHFNCSIFSLFSSSVAHCHWLHNSKLNSPHHTPAAQMTPGSHTEGHMIRPLSM